MPLVSLAVLARRVFGRAFVLLAALVLAWPAAAEGWQRYRIGQLGFSFEAPPEFTLDPPAAGSDSMTFTGPNGARLAVGGSDLARGEFLPLVRANLRQDEKEGWRVTYRRLTPRWASYSGLNDSQIRYVRAIPVCGGRIGLFVIDYAREDKRPFDPLIVRMVRSLRSEGC